MKQKNASSGFGITELLVAMGILAVIIAGFTQFMSSSQKSLKQMDVKGETQNLQTLMRLSLTKAEQCKLALGLAATMADSKVQATYGDMTGTGSHTIALNEITLVGKKYEVGASEKNLSVTGIKLEVEKKDAADFPATGTSYIAKLKIEAKPVNNSIRQSGYNSETTLLLDFKTAGTTAASKVWAESCYSESLMDPEKTCGDLGGRWLRGPESGEPEINTHYMSTPRCELAGDITLKSNEAPIGFEVMGGSNSSGERVNECYYAPNNSTTVKSYQCPSGSGNRAGYRCVFVLGSKQWQRRYFNASGAMRASASSDLVCNKGVRISVLSPVTEVLNFSEDLGVAYGMPAGTMTAEQYYDRLSSVESCVLNPEADTPVKCINPNDPVGALRGAARSCVWVNRSKPIGVPAVLNKFDPPLSSSAEFSGGWIYVDPAHTGTLTYQGIEPRLRNPRGRPCSSVLVNTSIFNDPGLNQASYAAPDKDLADAPTGVKQCLVQANDKVGGSTIGGRQIVYTCDNSDLTSWSENGDGYMDWIGATLYDDDDDGCAKKTACKVGLDDGLGNSPATTWSGAVNGTPGKGVPQLKKGSCWYFNRVRLSTFATGTVVPKGGLAGSTAVVTPSASTFSWTRTHMYTGWVWLNGNLPDNKFFPPAATYSLGDQGGLTPVTVFPGIPCTGGVRISN